MSPNAVAMPKPVATAARSSSGYTLVANEGVPQPLSAQSNDQPGVDPQEIAAMGVPSLGKWGMSAQYRK